MEDVAAIREAWTSDEYDLTKSLVMGFDHWVYVRERVKTGKANGDAAVEFT